MLLAQAGADAIVDHHAMLVGHQRIASAADGQLGKAEGVQAFEQFGGVGAAHVEAAQGGDVDQADLFAHMAGFFLHAAFALNGFAIVRRALPGAGGHHFCARRHMAAVHRRLPVRVEGTASDMRQLLGLKGWPGGGHAGFADAAPGGLGHQARGG